MIELGLVASLGFLLVAIVTSYLLRDALLKAGRESVESIEEAQLIALGMPPILSIKASFIIPWKKLPGIENLGILPKTYLGITRVAFSLAVFSIVLSIILAIW